MFCISLVFLFCDQNICVCDSCVHHPAEYKGNDSFPGAANKRAGPRWCKPWFKWRPCLSEPSLTRNHFWVRTHWAARTLSAGNSTHLSRTSNELGIGCWDTWKNQKIFVGSWLWEGSVCSCIFCKKVVLDFVDLFLSKYYCFAVMWSICQFWDTDLYIPISCHWCLVAIGYIAVTHFSTIILIFYDWLHWFRMKPHGWWVKFVPFLCLVKLFYVVITGIL